MSLITWAKTASQIWASSPTGYQPKKSEIRAYGLMIESQLDYAIAMGLPMLNGTLVATVAANVLTIALKTKAGADPSAADPVYLIFTNGTGGYDVVKQTAALSLVISAGSTLGVQATFAFCLWVTVWNNSGTAALGVRKCSFSGAIYSMADADSSSTTAEGGAGAADSAGTHYTASALTSKPYRVLGRIDWDAALATPGTWDTAPTRIRLYTPALKLPGVPLRHDVVVWSAGTPLTGTTPLDDSIPQIGNGNEIINIGTITRLGLGNPIRLHSEFQFGSSVAATIIAALHRTGEADALKSRGFYASTTDKLYGGSLSRQALYTPAASDTWSLRMGLSTAGTMTINGAAGSRLLGGSATSQLEYDEIQG